MSHTKLVVFALALGAIGCAYDAAERCGPGEVLSPAETCVCAANHVPVPRDVGTLVDSDPSTPPLRAGCRSCGEHAFVQGDRCACEPGYALGANGCVASNLGAPCTGDADCASGDQTYCQPTGGYCTTQACTATMGCLPDAGYVCDSSASPAYCRRPPAGEGNTCTAQGPDPACTTEAPMCASGTCHQAGCTSDDQCSAGRECCDLSAFSPGLTLCMAGGCP